MIGGNVYLREMNFGVSSNDEAKLFDDGSSSKRISMFTAVVLLVNAAMSTDPFFFGGYFNCGVLQSFLIGIFVMVMVIFSFKVYLQTWVYGSIYTYRDMWAKCFGKGTVFIPSLMILVAYSSITMLCTNEIYTDILEIVTYFFPDNYFTKGRWSWIFTVVLVTTFPFLLYSRGSDFYKLAYISKLGLLIGIGSVVYTFVQHIQREGFDPQQQMIWWAKKTDYSFEAFGGFNTVMFLHPVVHFIVRDMVEPTKKRIQKCIWYTELLTFISCLVAGYATYFILFENNDGENALQYFPPNNKATIIGKIGSVFSNIGLNSFYIWLLAQETCNLFLSGCSKANLARISSGIVVILFNIAMDFLNQAIIDIFGLMGNLSFIFLSFVFPSMFFLKIYGMVSTKWAIYTISVIVIAVPISLANFKYEVSALEW